MIANKILLTTFCLFDIFGNILFPMLKIIE